MILNVKGYIISKGKVKKIIKIVWIQPYHLQRKFKLWAGKVYCWVISTNLKHTFLLIIWIFSEGDGIKSRLPFKIFSTLANYKTIFCRLPMVFQFKELNMKKTGSKLGYNNPKRTTSTFSYQKFLKEECQNVWQ